MGEAVRTPRAEGQNVATFAASETGLVVRSGGEVLQVDAWGDSGIRVRATLGASVTETPWSALLEDEARTARVEIGDGRARVSNGDLIVEVVENGEGRFVPFPPLLRFLRADGMQLLAESLPHFTSPAQRRHPGGSGPPT